MSRSISHDGQRTLEVRFPFDRDLVELVKTLPGRRWNAVERFWSVPATEVVSLVELLAPAGFGVDRATRELYRGMGGTRELPVEESSAERPTLPGLFDAIDDDAGNPDPTRETTDYTVSGLNERVREAIRLAIPGEVWLVGEISGFDKSAHRRHVSFELVERADDGTVVSKIPVVLFSQARQAIADRLRLAGDPMRLEDELAVRLRVKVDLYVAWGQYRVVVEDLDVRYTLGEAARRREEIVRRLAAAGLTERNRGLGLPALPLRIGLITSLGSDAFNDVVRTLAESGFAFDVTAHGARVQGGATEASVLNALDYFRARAGSFDVILICRGGGSRTDLVWFDSEALGAAVAEFPLPVLVGIGHEQDLSVLDAVGWSCKTPTAAAALLVERVTRAVERLSELGREVLALANERIGWQRRAVAERAGRLARAARARLRHERELLRGRQRRAVVGSRAAVAAARDRLARWTALIPRDARVLLERQRLWLAGATSTLGRSARHRLERASERIGRTTRAVPPAARRGVERELERTTQRARRLSLVDPRRVLDRGYSILRVEAGRVITRADEAPAGTSLQADLKQGRLRLRSLGGVVADGGD